jgi:hypothetical protein
VPKKVFFYFLKKEKKVLSIPFEMPHFILIGNKVSLKAARFSTLLTVALRSKRDARVACISMLDPLHAMLRDFVDTSGNLSATLTQIVIYDSNKKFDKEKDNQYATQVLTLAECVWHFRDSFLADHLVKSVAKLIKESAPDIIIVTDIKLIDDLVRLTREFKPSLTVYLTCPHEGVIKCGSLATSTLEIQFEMTPIERRRTLFRIEHNGEDCGDSFMKFLTDWLDSSAPKTTGKAHVIKPELVKIEGLEEVSHRTDMAPTTSGARDIKLEKMSDPAKLISKQSEVDACRADLAAVARKVEELTLDMELAKTEAAKTAIGERLLGNNFSLHGTLLSSR